MNFTVVLPIHNEEKMLPYSLPSIYELQPNEILLFFDRCTDNSIKISKKISLIYPQIKTRVFIIDYISKEWKSRIGAIRREGFHKSSYDLILNADSDMVLDNKIREYIKEIGGEIAMIKLGFLDYPLNIRTLLKRIISTFTLSSIRFKGYSGLYAFSKKVWLETEQIEEAKQAEAEDAILQISISRKYKILYRNTKTLHLRPTETKEKNFWRGTEYRKTVHASWISVFFHSFIMLRPHLLYGYLYAKRSERARVKAA